ncbi:hypothetical protein ONZ45_g6561 [Pleurotus djamor]|nr:hypothetical protein ONZ45_g6561 [Pleurotus djamor]
MMNLTPKSGSSEPGSGYQFPYPNTLIPVPYYTDTSLATFHRQLIPMARTSRQLAVTLPPSPTTDVDMSIDSENQPLNTIASVLPDGLLLYVSEASYEPGTSPLSSWVPIEYTENDLEGDGIKKSYRPLDHFENLIQRRLAIRSGEHADVEM